MIHINTADCAIEVDGILVPLEAARNSGDQRQRVAALMAYDRHVHATNRLQHDSERDQRDVGERLEP